MQSIERYGLVALIFLVITVVAVLLWDEEPDPSQPVAKAEQPPAQEQVPNRVTMRSPAVKTGGKGLARDLLAEQDAPEAPLVASRSVPTDQVAPGGIVPADARAAAETVALDARAESSSRERDTEAADSRGRGPATPASSSLSYVIRSGDTLSEISMRELGTMKRWEEIVALNPGLDATRLVVGREIRLPVGPVPKSAVEPRPRSIERGGTPATEGASYVVRSGDSLWKIAQSVLGDGERWREIAKLNPGLDAGRLAVGRSIVLPTGARKTSEAPRETVALRGSQPATAARVR